MDPVNQLLRTTFLSFALTSFLLVHGQQSIQTLGSDLSPACIWNASESTWAALGFSPDKVRQVEEIRQRYPLLAHSPTGTEPSTTDRALPDTKDDPRVHRNTDDLGRMKPTAGKDKQASSDASQVEQTSPAGLNEELRAVLTQEELRKWREYCLLQERE